MPRRQQKLRGPAPRSSASVGGTGLRGHLQHRVPDGPCRRFDLELPERRPVGDLTSPPAAQSSPKLQELS